MRSLLVLLAVIALTSPASPWQMQQDPLDHTKWHLVSTEKAGDLKLGARPATILFEEGGYTISACNTMSGKYKVEAKTIGGTPGISTRKACLPDAQALDEALLKAIDANHSFEITGTKLTIMDDDGGTFVFSAVAIPSKNAVTKFIYVASETKDCEAGGTTKCLQIRDSKDQPWTNYHGRIVGFRPVPGIEYRLRIKEDTVKNPPAGGSSKIWFLDLVVEQSVVDKAAADAFYASQKKK
jgi:heat shock protein HslJ